jgi:hypothetical protein
MSINWCSVVHFGTYQKKLDVYLYDLKIKSDVNFLTHNKGVISAQGCTWATLEDQRVQVCAAITNLKTELYVSGCLTMSFYIGPMPRLYLGCFKLQKSTDEILLFRSYLGRILEGKK